MRRGRSSKTRRAYLGVAAGLLAVSLWPTAARAADGDLDPSFSGDGKQTTDLGGGDFAEDVAIQPNGKIVVLVNRDATSVNQFSLIRYNRDGSLDPTFSANGIITAGLGGEPGQDESASDLALQGGKIVVAGTTGGFGGSGRSEFAVIRFTRDGVRDRSFAGDGTKTISFNPRRDYSSGASAVAIDDRRRIVVAGSQVHHGEGGFSFAVARLTPDGALDRSFSRDGKQLTSFFGCDAAESVAVTRNGGVVVVGNVGYCRAIDFTAWGLARYRPDGRLDRSFAGDGRRLGFRDIGDGRAADVAVSGGRIVVAGTRNGHFALARYRRDGTRDRSFSGDGRQITSVHPAHLDIASDLAIQRGGKIVVAGRTFFERGDPRPGRGPTPVGNFALARYLDNGRLDRSFSGDGKRTLLFGAHGPDAARGLAIQENGAIVVAGVDSERLPDVDTGLFPRADERSRHTEDIAVARFKG